MLSRSAHPGSSFLRYPIRGSKFSYSVEIREHLLSVKTAYQQIDIYDTYCFGKILTLDGHVQLSTLDEFAYHETLVHIPLLSIPDPKSALVVGGGDGGVLRELCKWPSLSRIDMVEIDEGVIDACKDHLPELSLKAFQDPRVNLTIGDAFPFMASVAHPYDLIVMDITDVYEEEDGGLSESLFTDEFHRDTYNSLCPQGFLVSQADNHLFCPYSLDGLQKILQQRYAKVGSYQALVPSFGGFSAFCWASKEGQINEQWPAENKVGLRYLGELTYNLAFADLPFEFGI